MTRRRRTFREPDEGQIDRKECKRFTDYSEYIEAHDQSIEAPSSLRKRKMEWGQNSFPNVLLFTPLSSEAQQVWQ